MCYMYVRVEREHAINPSHTKYAHFFAFKEIWKIEGDKKIFLWCKEDDEIEIEMETTSTIKIDLFR